MKPTLNPLRTLLMRVDALSQRERVILFVLLLAGVWTLFDFAVLKPQQRALKAQQARLTEGQAALLKAQELLAQRLAQPDPEALARQRLEQARKALEQRLQAAQTMQQRLVSPKNMVKVLEGLLANQPSLHLRSLQTLAPVSLGLAADAKAGDAKSSAVKTEGAALYKHGVTLTVSGSYEALTRYLERLERLPAGFYWESASLDASQHPAIELTLTLNTLSLERTWLSL